MSAADGFALNARALTKSYGTHRGIVEVDLQVAAGEVVGLVGANGAGKTTLMRTILDFVRPTSGAVCVFGLDSVKESVEVRRRSAYLPGELAFPPRLRGEEVLRRYTAARTALDPARVRSLTDRLDLDMSRRVQELSKGNKQKLGLVRLSSVVDSRPRLLVAHGHRRDEALAHAGLTVGDVYALLREHGVARLEDVAYLLYETKGAVTLVRREEDLGPVITAGLEAAGYTDRPPPPGS